MTNRSLLLCFILLCVFFVSCTQTSNPCLSPTNAQLKMHSLHFTTDTSTIPADTILPSAVLVATNTKGQSEAYFYPATTSLSAFLSTTSDSTNWLITADTSKVNTLGYDTLSFYYQRQLHFISNACGYTYFFNLTNVKTTKHNIDSVIIENTSVTTNANTENLKIYFKPDF